MAKVNGRSHLESTLEDKKEILKRRVVSHQHDLTAGQENMDLIGGLCANDLLMLRQIEEQLARVRSGTHRECRECMKKIPSERLEALPEATTCIDCAQGQNGVHRSAGEQNWDRLESGQENPEPDIDDILDQLPFKK